MVMYFVVFSIIKVRSVDKSLVKVLKLKEIGLRDYFGGALQ
jgi:hypothetical protein